MQLPQLPILPLPRVGDVLRPRLPASVDKPFKYIRQQAELGQHLRFQDRRWTLTGAGMQAQVAELKLETRDMAIEIGIIKVNKDVINLYIYICYL
jgi:hypothetical protein